MLLVVCREGFDQRNSCLREIFLILSIGICATNMHQRSNHKKRSPLDEEG